MINKFSVELISILLNIRDYDLVLESLKSGMSGNFDNKTKTCEVIIEIVYKKCWPPVG